MTNKCKSNVVNQAYLNFMLKCSLSMAKIVQTESHELALMAEAQPIFCKDNIKNKKRPPEGSLFRYFIITKLALSLSQRLL